LKLDKSEIEQFEEEYKIDFNVIGKYFIPCKIADLLEEKIVSDGEKHYVFIP